MSHHSPEQESNKSWTKIPLKMEVGNVNNKHFVLALKVKSILDPCEDENTDDEVSLGADSVQIDDSSDSDSEVDRSPEEDDYIVTSVDLTDDDDEDMDQLNRVRYWIISRHIDIVELTDVLSSFPDISMGKAEIQQNGSIRSEQTTGNNQVQGNTPMSKLERVPSQESNDQGEEHDQTKGRNHSKGDDTICSISTQDKRARKASMDL